MPRQQIIQETDWILKLSSFSALWNTNTNVCVTSVSRCIFCVLQWPAKSCRIMETIPAYGQQQSCRYLCWTAQVNIAVYLLWALFHYIWPILGSFFAYTCSNRSGATTAVLWPLYPWRSARRWWEAGECCNIECNARLSSWNLW